MKDKLLSVKVLSYFGAFVISVGTNVFPRLFKTRREAEEVAEQIRKSHNL